MFGTLVSVVSFLTALPKLLAMLGSFFATRKKNASASSARPDCPEDNEYAVLVCAHNEEDVVSGILDSIRSQSYDGSRLKTFVVADNCADRTAEIARAHGAVVFERHDLSRVGKGPALHFLFEKLKEDAFAQRCRGFIVFDADNLADPDFVREINRTVCAGSELCKGFRASTNLSRNLLTECNGFDLLGECEGFDRGRTRYRIGSSVTGTGFFVSRRLIEAEGGWNYLGISEDTEFSVIMLMKYGVKVQYDPAAVFYDEQPDNLKETWKQKKRWLFGPHRVFRQYGGKLLAFAIRERSLTAFDFFSNVIGCGVISTAGAVLALLTALSAFLSGGAAALGGSVLSWFSSVYALPFLYGVLYYVVAWKRIPLSLPKKVRLLLVFPLFKFLYTLAGIRAFFTKDMVWKRTEHDGKHDSSVAAKLAKGSGAPAGAV